MDTSVLIVGAGPTGLMLALLLKRQGITCRIIDLKTQATQTSNALAVQPRTLEIWQDLGFADKAIQRGLKITSGAIHANKKILATIDLKTIDSAFPFILGLPQHDTETLLIEQLLLLGIKVERDKKLMAFEQDAHCIQATIENGAAQEVIECGWLIACDGYHSTTRQLLNIDYVGSDLKEHFIMMDVPITSSLLADQINVFFSPQGAFIILPMPGRSRIIAEISHDPMFSQAANIDVETFKIISQQRCKVPLEFSAPLWQSSFWVHERIASQYQYGRVFLAGDAAHAHSPAGGQGMNLGLQDAHNLAWKLALVINKKAHETLLDSYALERRPIAKTILKSSTYLTKTVSLQNRFLIALRNNLLHLVMSRKTIKQKIASTLTQLNVHYKNKKPTKSKIGERAVLFNNQYGYVLALSAEAMYREAIKEMIARRYASLIAIHCFEPHRLKLHQEDSYKSDYYLIRPDQYIAFCGKSIKDLKQYLQQHFIL